MPETTNRRRWAQERPNRASHRSCPEKKKMEREDVLEASSQVSVAVALPKPISGPIPSRPSDLRSATWVCPLTFRFRDTFKLIPPQVL